MANRRTKQQLARQRPSAAGSVNTQTQPRTVPQKAHGNARKSNSQHRASLADRMTRHETSSPPQPGGKTQAAPGQASATKRKRGETDIGAQEQKRLRANTIASSAPVSQVVRSDSPDHINVVETDVQPATTDLRTLQNMTDEEKMARRLNRFASKVTKTSGNNEPASIRKPRFERKAASTEKAVSSPDFVISTQSHEAMDRDSTGATILQDCPKKMDRGSESPNTKLFDHTIDKKADSVMQSSPASNTKSQHAGGQMIRDTLPQGSPCYGTKGSVRDQTTGAMADLNQSTQLNHKQQVAQTDRSHTRHKTRLQTPCVIINDDRQPAIEPNPEFVLNYKPYDHTSILLLASLNIMHDEAAEESINRFFRSNQLFNQQALDMYKRPWTSEDLGRGTVNKTLRTRIIDDCDLYYHIDQKIYVATPTGLLLAADYCKIIGIPDEQGVRFEGRKPKWTKKLEADRHWRRVEISCPYNTDAILQPCLALTQGLTVEVYERCRGVDSTGTAWDFAYGRRPQDGARGFFDYDSTCRMDWARDPTDEVETPDYAVFDWGKFDYGPMARNARQYLASRNINRYAPPLPRQNTSARTAPAAVSGPRVSPTKSSGNGNVSTPRASTSTAATASTAVGEIEPITSTSSTSSFKEAQAHKGTSSLPAADRTTTLGAVPIVTVDQDIQSAEMLDVAGGPVENVAQDKTAAVRTCSNDEASTSSCASNTAVLRPSRHDSHEPSINTNVDEAKASVKGGMADRSCASNDSVDPSTPLFPTTRLGTIRPQISPVEYVEDEVDYDDDEL